MTKSTSSLAPQYPFKVELNTIEVWESAIWTENVV
jgi:hypothetical protein